MKTKAILFDIDGTIVDTHDFVFDALQYTLDKHNLKVTEAQLAKVVGKQLDEFYKTLFPQKDHRPFAKSHRDFQSKYFHSVNIFPGVKEVLRILKIKGILIGAVSNRSRDSLIKSLKIEKIDNFFDAVVAADDVKNPKPHKDHPEKALEILGVEKELAIMVGDTENDILAGKNAGIKTVGVSYGWIGEDIKKYKPDFVIYSMSELLEVLKTKGVK